MRLHAPTIMTLMSGIAALIAIALTLEWRRSRVTELVWWAFGYGLLVGSLVLTLLLPSGLNFLALGIGSMLALASHAVLLQGCRIHAGRRLRLWLFLPPLVWLLLWSLRWSPIPLADSFVERRVFSSAMVALYCFGTVPLFWSKPTGLRTERHLAIAFGIHSVVYAIRLILDLAEARVNEPAMNDPILIVQMVEGTLFAVVSATLFLSLARDMMERTLAAASRTDFLTGIDNRRAFFDKAGPLVAHPVLPLSLAVLDLDHFKTINDRHGHAGGDEVLKLFARIVRSDLGPNDVFARTGGEEFALLLPNQTPQQAADRLRRLSRRFAEASAIVLDPDPPATFSAGLVAAEPLLGLEVLLGAADTALYRAKRLGRNRVEMAIQPRKPGHSDAARDAEALGEIGPSSAPLTGRHDTERPREAETVSAA